MTDPNKPKGPKETKLSPKLSEEEISKAAEGTKKSIENQKTVANLRQGAQGEVEELKNKLIDKESKEKMKTSELEKNNHKIDEGKSKKEKLAEGWKEEERPAYIDGFQTKIKVLKKELAPGAFVREYQDDSNMPKHLIGEQLFNWKAVLSLGLKNRLPTWRNMVAMRGETKEEKDNFLKNNFQKDGENLFHGYWDPDYKEFRYFGGRTGCRLSDGGGVGLNKRDMHRKYSGNGYCFSLRLLKN